MIKMGMKPKTVENIEVIKIMHTEHKTIQRKNGQKTFDTHFHFINFR